jgi:hypothetical protein
MRLLRIAALMLAPAGVAAFPATASAQTPNLQFGIGANYSSGDYGGTTKIQIYEAPLSARLKAGAWSFRVRVPFASVDGGSGVVPGGEDTGGTNDRRGSNSGSGSNGSGSGGSGSGSSGSGGSGSGGSGWGGSGGGTTTTPTTTTTTTAVVASQSLGKRSGLGDMTASATYTFDVGANTYLDLTGQVYLPTGDAAKDLGTGETDYSFGGELGHDGEGGGYYASGGYRVRGGAGRSDGPYAAAGGYGRFGKSTIVGAEISWSKASISGIDDPAALTAYVSFDIHQDVRLSTFAEAGLSKNAPDYSAGLTLTWRPNMRRPFQSH